MSKAQAVRPVLPTRSHYASMGLLGVLVAWLTVPLPLQGREPKFLSQFYLANDPASLQSLQKNYLKISLVCPQWFSVDEAGKLESTVDSSVVNWAGGKG